MSKITTVFYDKIMVIGDRVIVARRHKGTIRYIGETMFASGLTTFFDKLSLQ